MVAMERDRQSMTPSEYEALIASRYVAQGFEVEHLPYTNDSGIDVIAARGSEEIANQVKRNRP